MAKRSFCALLAGIALSLCGAAGASDLDTVLGACSEHAYGGWPTGAAGTPLCRAGYAVLHDNAKKIPAWSAYRLTAAKATACMPRTDNFRPDEEVPIHGRAQLADYKNSGYDRGHIVPAGDMQWSAEAMSQSFLLSNMAPQLGSFNRGIWKQLETRVRIWARDRGEVLVIDGPYYEGDQFTIGPNQVAVPQGFFKLVLDPRTKETQAFLLPHGKIPSRNLPLYRISIREIERRTGLNFHPSLSGVEQDEIESVVSDTWPVNLAAWAKERTATCPADKD